MKAGLHQPEVVGGQCRLGAGGDIELAVDLLDVAIDGVAAQLQQPGGFGQGHALADQPQHLMLARGQRRLRLRQWLGRLLLQQERPGRNAVGG